MSCVTWCEYAGILPDKDDDSLILQWEVTLGTFSNWFRNQSLAILAGETPVLPTQFYIKMHSTESDADAAGDELVGSNYFKTPVTFESVSEVQIRNAATINSQLSSDAWEDIYSFTIWDEADNYYAFGNLKAPVAIIAGKGIQWPAGGITIGIGNVFRQGFSNYYIEQILKSFLLELPTVPTQLSISAHSTAGSSIGPGTELSGDGYTRTDVALVRATDRQYINTVAVASSNATDTWPVLSYSLYDQINNYYGFFSLSTATFVAAGERIEWAVASISANLGNLTPSGVTNAVINFSTDTITCLRQAEVYT